MTQLQLIDRASEFSGYALGALRVAAERFADFDQPEIARHISDLHDTFLAMANVRADAGQLLVESFLGGYWRGYREFNCQMTMRQAYDVYKTAANNLRDVLAD